MLRARLATAVLCCLAASTALPASAAAAGDQESMFQDDNLIVYAEPAAVAQTMDKLKGLGVDRLRVSVFWAVVAPDARKQQKPAGFDGADPAAYPDGSWDRYDTIVRLARQRGLGVNFNVTSPAPFWATGSLEGRPDLDETYAPDPAEFGAFVRAVGTRYSGSYVPPARSSSPSPPPPRPGLLPRQAPADASPLPRVDYWTVWNEPNQPGWLTPQWTDVGGQLVQAAPHIYRALLDQMYAGLVATGHEKDTVLVGETAPKGQQRVKGPTRAIKPGLFIRQLYCLDDNLQFLQGLSAQARGCPADPSRFAADHPGLFETTGYAHHPYELVFGPSRPPKYVDDFTTGNLGQLSSLLRRVFQRYGQSAPGGGRDVPLFLTEFGYQTRPPDPNGVTFAQQAAYLNEAEWIAFRNPRVRALTQFLLVDDGPTPGEQPFGVTFQSGLMTREGAAKPALAAYALPIFLPKRSVEPRGKLRVFGLVRLAQNGRAPRVALQLRSKSGAYKTLRTLTATRGRGYVDTTFTPKRSGAVRLAWSSGGTLTASRAVSFTVKRR